MYKQRPPDPDYKILVPKNEIVASCS